MQKTRIEKSILFIMEVIFPHFQAYVCDHF